MRHRPDIEQLLTAIREHVRHEQRMIDHYREAAARAEGARVRFLVDFILQDEERHHALMIAMAERLEGAVTGQPAAGALPVARDEGRRSPELMELTERFIAAEKRGIAEDKALRAACEGIGDGLFSLLLDAMALDSRKHVLILEYLRTVLGQEAEAR